MQFSTTTTDADPGTGFIRFDNADQSAATTVRIDDQDVSSSDFQTWIATFDDSSNTPPGHIYIAKLDDPNAGHIFTVVSLSEQTGYWNIVVTHLTELGGAQPLADNDGILLGFVRAGDLGDTGAQGNTGQTGLTGTGLQSRFKAITIEDPTSSEDISWFFTNIAITVIAVEGVLNNGTTTPTVTVELIHHTDRANAGNDVFAAPRAVTSITTGDNLTLGGDVTIPANSFVWIETTAQGGTVPELHLTVRYTED
jgi:hypothetical protein